MPRNISLTSPTDYTAELASIERRRKLAELMQQQGATPLGNTETVGGWAIPRSPMEGIGKMAQALSGSYQQNQLDERTKALAEKLRGDRQQDYAALLGGMQGTPARDIQAPTFEGMTGGMDQQDIPQKTETIPAIPGGQINPAIIAQLRTPEGQAAALQMLQQQSKPTSIGSGGLRLGSGEIIPPAARPQGPQSIGAGGLRLPDGTVIPPVQNKGEWGEPYQMGGSWVQKNSVTGQVRQAVNREPQIRVDNPPSVTTTEVIDPNNANQLLKIDARTYKGGSIGSPGVLGVSGKLGDVAKLENKRQFNMQGIGATIAEAEALLTSKVKPPTGSGVGAAYDYAASLVGASPAGSVEAQRLKAIGGALTSKMPRMEGPQSDRDTTLYKEMAGMVGDPTVPVERRVAALDEVKKLWAKYERLNPDAFSDRRETAGLPDAAAIDAEIARRKKGKP